MVEKAEESQITYVELPGGIEPRMAVINNLCGLVSLLASFKIITGGKIMKLTVCQIGYKPRSVSGLAKFRRIKIYAKQLALKRVGKTAVFYGGTLTAPVAYKWKISWNENAKNVAFWNELPEFNHNEFIGWTMIFRGQLW